MAMKVRQQFREVLTEVWRRWRDDPVEFATFVARYWLRRAHIGPSSEEPDSTTQGQR